MNEPIRIVWVIDDESDLYDDVLNDYYTVENIDLDTLLRNYVFGNIKLNTMKTIGLQKANQYESYDAKSIEIVFSNVTILNVHRINRASRKIRKRFHDFSIRFVKIMTEGLNPHIIICDNGCILASRLNHANCFHQIGSCALFKTDEGLLMITNYNEMKTMRPKHISALVEFIRDNFRPIKR